MRHAVDILLLHRLVGQQTEADSSIVSGLRHRRTPPLMRLQMEPD